MNNQLVTNKELLHKLEKVTYDFNDFLNNIDLEQDPNAINQINRFIKQRDNIINLFNTKNLNWNKEEEKLIYQLIDVHNKCLEKLDVLYNNIRVKLKKINQSKRVSQGYNGLYDTYKNAHSSYFDKRK